MIFKFVYCHILVSRSGMPVGWVIVRLVDDYYQVGGEREEERRLRSSCDLCEQGIFGLVCQQWLGEWRVESARN